MQLLYLKPFCVHFSIALAMDFEQPDSPNHHLKALERELYLHWLLPFIERCPSPGGRGEKTTYPVADAGSNAPGACGSLFM